MLPDDGAHPGIFLAEVDRVRSSLTDEERALPQYGADNRAAWADYFQRRQAQRLASTNGAPVLGGLKNSDGRRVWWGVPGRTLHEVLAYLEGLPVVKTEPGLAGGFQEEELDEAADLKWARDDWAQTELQRQRLAFEAFEARRRGRDEGGVVVLDDSDDDDVPPPPVRQGDAGQGSSRGGRAIKE